MLLRAVTTVHLPDHQTIEEGEFREDSDPVVKKYPQFFAEPTARRDAGVEEATARPGAKRTTSRTKD